MSLFSKKGLPKEKKSKFSVLISIAVLAIIIILLGLAVIIVCMSRIQSRDTERILEINNLREALQFHYVDKGYYPIETEWCSLESDCEVLSKEIESYLSTLPRDPLYPKEEKRGKYSYQYRTTDDGSEYKIYAILEEGGPYGLGSKGSFIISPPQSE